MACCPKPLLLAATLLLGVCGPLSPAYAQRRSHASAPEMVTVYHCGETRSTPLGTLAAEPDTVSWTRDLGDGMSIWLSLSLYDEALRAAFGSRGFEGWEFAHPLTFFNFSRKYSKLNWRVGNGRTVAGQVRIGTQTVDAWMPSNMTMAVDWPAARRLMREPGDVLITLHDNKGAVLQQASIPHDAWLEAEAALREMHARVMARFRDKDNQCHPTREEAQPPIVIAD